MIKLFLNEEVVNAKLNSAYIWVGGQRRSSQSRANDTGNVLVQHCPIALSAEVEMFCICAGQYKATSYMWLLGT